MTVCRWIQACSWFALASIRGETLFACTSSNVHKWRPPLIQDPLNWVFLRQRTLSWECQMETLLFTDSVQWGMQDNCSEPYTVEWYSSTCMQHSNAVILYLGIWQHCCAVMLLYMILLLKQCRILVLKAIFFCLPLWRTIRSKSEILSHSSNRLTEVVLVLKEDALRLFGGCIWKYLSSYIHTYVQYVDWL